MDTRSTTAECAAASPFYGGLSRRRLRVEDCANVTCDHHVFAGGHRLDGEVSEEAQPFGYGSPNVAPVLADAAREGKGVDATECGRHRGDGLCDPGIRASTVGLAIL